MSEWSEVPPNTRVELWRRCKLCGVSYRDGEELTDACDGTPDDWALVLKYIAPVMDAMQAITCDIHFDVSVTAPPDTRGKA